MQCLIIFVTMTWFSIFNLLTLHVLPIISSLKNMTLTKNCRHYSFKNFCISWPPKIKYQARKVSSHVHMCVRGINFATFYDFSIGSLFFLIKFLTCNTDTYSTLLVNKVYWHQTKQLLLLSQKFFDVMIQSVTK
jgi:hypothetical protein